MRPKAIYYNILRYQEDNLTLLQEYFDVTILETPEENTDQVLGGVEVLFAPLGYMWDNMIFKRCPKLKVLGSNTTGHPHIDVQEAEKLGIEVVTLKDETEFLATITPTAEHTFGLILAVTRNLLPAALSVQKGKWDRRPYGGQKMLSKMKLGIVGYGRLGKMVAKYALSFGMKVSFYDPYVENVGLYFCSTGVNRNESLKELVSTSDIVTLHVPHLPETENLIDAEIFSSFLDNSYFINTSRGELVDHHALLDNLQNDHLAGVALDVFQDEFTREFSLKSHPLWRYSLTNNNVLITPHIGGSTIDAWRLTEEFTIKTTRRKFDEKFTT